MYYNETLHTNGNRRQERRLRFLGNIHKRKDAQKYKEAFKWYIESDKIKVKTKRGYFDANKD